MDLKTKGTIVKKEVELIVGREPVKIEVVGTKLGKRVGQLYFAESVYDVTTVVGKEQGIFKDIFTGENV